MEQKTTTISELTQSLLDANKTEYEYNDIVNLHNSIRRHIYLGEIDEQTGDYVESLIRFWNLQDEQDNIPVENREPIKFFINSPGGSLTSTFTMIDAIAMSQTPVWTINTGMAYSGGFFTFIAGHKRVTYKHSSFLFHEGSTMTGGDAGKFRNYADFYKKELDALKNIVLEYTDIKNDLYEIKKNDDWWMTANEALELGVCDEVCEKLIY